MPTIEPGLTRTEVFNSILSFIQDPSNAYQITDLIMANNPKKSSSFQAQVLDLSPGESCSKVRAVDPSTPVGRLPDELSTLRQNLRNTIAPAIKRATDLTGHAYTAEVGETVMPGGTLYIVAIVTCKLE